MRDPDEVVYVAIPSTGTKDVGQFFGSEIRTEFALWGRRQKTTAIKNN
jgi:hypothetical protein